MLTRAAIDKLSERERQIVRLVAEGHSNAEIARELTLTVQTVKNRLSDIYLKLGVKSRTELTVALFRNGTAK
jgi:DNA-binding NarL/FixJ family response regulator